MTGLRQWKGTPLRGGRHLLWRRLRALGYGALVVVGTVEVVVFVWLVSVGHG